MFARLFTHVFCVALALVPVDCQHVHYTATVIMVRACFLKILQHLVVCTAISAHGKVVHLPNTFHFALPCPVTHVTMERHLHSIPRDGLLPKIDTLDGARGPLVAITAMSGTRMYREGRLRPGWYNPRLGPMRKSRLWMNVTRTRVGPRRTMPWAA